MPCAVLSDDPNAITQQKTSYPAIWKNSQKIWHN